MKYFFLLLLIISVSMIYSRDSKRWQLTDDESICWIVKDTSSHSDHIEMSGLQVSAVIHYGISDEGQLKIDRRLVFPMLRTIPNDTHASLIYDFNEPKTFVIKADGKTLREFPHKFTIKGKLVVESKTNSSLEVKRTIFPSSDKAAVVEIVNIINRGELVQKISILNNSDTHLTDPAKGVYGRYIVKMDLNKSGEYSVLPGQQFSFSAVYSGKKEYDQDYLYSAKFELQKREKFVNEIFGSLILETPNDTINREFAFAKIRAAESIYDTKGGLMHGPGGESYYAAIWANDQAEYTNPFFPFLGDINGNESAINSFRHFARYINPEYKPIPSSIIAEGTDIWNGVGDRGDQAMIAYGASRFALASGKKETAEELWPLITWCIEYLEKKVTEDGVIASDTDELENRFSSGKVNLSTNSLAYGAYISAANLAEELSNKNLADKYRNKAASLRKAIDKYFGAKVQGFDTYSYHKENDKLRSWICMPLVMGITERMQETINALFSDYLWTNNGILTESGSSTFWDRSTLYAFRGLFACGAADKCIDYFSYYSATRLLGEHVPYPVEAWPEGNQRHLSAESALYCRVVTEGLFGITPVGFNKFTIAPLLPAEWNVMKLKGIKAFNRTFDVEVKRNENEEIIIISDLNDHIQTIKWNMSEPALLTLQ